jgi:hypothetical protein
MKTLNGVIKTNKQGSDCHFQFEVEDDATEEDIEEALRERAFEFIEYWVAEL